MLPSFTKTELALFTARRHLNKNLYTSIYYATEAINAMAADMCADHHEWQRNYLGHTFNVGRTPYGGDSTVMDTCRAWMCSHEETQVMLASILVVIGLWWLVRVVLSLLLNLICPLLVVLLAVICVPQLRDPLLGQNYQALANMIRCILLKMAENIKTQPC